MTVLCFDLSSLSSCVSLLFIASSSRLTRVRCRRGVRSHAAAWCRPRRGSERPQHPPARKPGSEASEAGLPSISSTASLAVARFTSPLLVRTHAWRILPSPDTIGSSTTPRIQDFLFFPSTMYTRSPAFSGLDSPNHFVR
uniref:(northern house mosquito) hypothetical protein n=1 Tax=Culex pipiens TaxID=7175 RepID=A0A8D8FS87_CULPI